MTKAMEYASAGERAHARALVRCLLKRGLTVSVFDGEEWTVKKSSAEREILTALATTEEDQLVARDAAGDKVGWFYLVWGNEEDGSCLIADHTANELCEEIADEIAGNAY